RVVQELDLNASWGRKYGTGGNLKTVESVGLLKSRLEVRPVHNTSIIEIRIFSEDRDEAAMIANKIAEVYAERVRSTPGGSKVEIIDRAVPGSRPVRPNKPLNIVLGIVAGLVLGLVVGGAGAALAHGWQSKRQRSQPVS